MTPEERAERLAQVRAAEKRCRQIKFLRGLARRADWDAPHWLMLPAYTAHGAGLPFELRCVIRKAVEDIELGVEGARDRTRRALLAAADYLEVITPD